MFIKQFLKKKSPTSMTISIAWVNAFMFVFYISGTQKSEVHTDWEDPSKVSSIISSVGSHLKCLWDKEEKFHQKNTE